jgi:sugar O-acyltransferase (sialic acid O-acetyltransferase NeuD family)
MDPLLYSDQVLNSNPLIVFGAGGHAKVIADILSLQGEKISCFIDETHAGKSIDWAGGAPCISEQEMKAKFKGTTPRGIAAIGDNWTRSLVVARLEAAFPEFQFLKAIHPSAVVAKSASLGAGTVVMPGAIVGAGSKIGCHVILNTQSSVDHDCDFGDYSSTAPGAILGGDCKIGTFSAISLGAKLIHGIHIGSHTVIGAGSLVLKPVPELVTAFGSPLSHQEPRCREDRYF